MTKVNASSLVNAAPLLQYALKQLYSHETQANKLNAVIYLSKGDHFFFTCSGAEKEYFTRKTFENLYDYCTCLDLARQQQFNQNDNIEITIQALECKMKSTFTLTNEEYKAFDELCVDLESGEDKPTIYVNNIYTYFNITGKMTVKNIKFSGVNGLATNDNQKLNFDYSVLPQLYCEMPGEPSGIVNSNLLGADEIYEDSELYSYMTSAGTADDIIISCDFYGTNVLKPPPLDLAQTDQCYTNKGEYYIYEKSGSTVLKPGQTIENVINNQPEKQFPQLFRSTWKCGGEIFDTDWLKNNNDEDGIEYGLRRTLFNIYSFPDHLSIRNATPELIIENCDFEYFLADGYESLITIESYAFSKQDYIDYTFNAGTSDLSEDQTRKAYFYHGQDRGAKITIKSSTFKHSRFCKGMIVYRPSFYYTDSESIVNVTNLFMKSPLKNNTDSWILVRNSEFTNLNAFTQVQSLALTGAQQQTEIIEQGVSESFEIPGFVNKGIVLNIQDFGGRVEILGSVFDRNMHYIPGIVYLKTSQASLPLELFVDQFGTQELQFTICYQGKNTYLFGSSQILTQSYSSLDIDSFFENYERLSLIYISRPQNLVLFKDNQFTRNIGTFGGAITINSPDWQNGYQPHIVLRQNMFKGNMAYFSGNAVYIRNTIIKQLLEPNITCGGVNFIDNTFIDNIGMKVHNGGAVSAYCHYIDVDYHEDYFSSSAILKNITQNSSSLIFNQSTITVTSSQDGSLTQIQRFKFNFQGNIFENNYSGSKGTALYIRQISSIRIIGNSFVGNGPVYSIAENAYSPYVRYLSGRSMTYYDDTCSDEFSFLENCNSDIDVSQYGGVQWSNVQGAIFAQFCEEDFCLNNNATQELEIEACEFIKNQAGPALDISTQLTASQIFVKGGMNMTVTGCTFQNNRGSQYTFLGLQVSKLRDYFPQNYFEYSMSPLINVQMNPPSKVRYNKTMNFTIKQSKFYQNRNIQVMGLSAANQYFGSLVQMENVATIDPINSQLLVLTVEDCDFKENIVTGPESSLIFAYKIQARIHRSTFQNNGRITQNTISRYKQDKAKYVTSTDFNFKSYTFQDIQYYGCIMLEGESALPFNQSHEFVNNTFSYIFAYEGVAYQFITMDSQDIYISGNTYFQLYAQNSGAILYWQENRLPGTILIERDKASFLFALENGAIRVKPFQKQQPIIVIKNSSFTNVHSKNGQAIYLFENGKLRVENVNFTRGTLNIGPAMYSYSKNTFKKLNFGLFEYFIDINVFSAMTQTLIQYTGYVYLENVKVAALPSNIKDRQNILFRGKTLLNVSDPYYSMAEFINCNFQLSTAESQGAIYAYNSVLRVANIVNKNGSNAYFIANNTVNSKGVIGIEGGSVFIGENLQFHNNNAENRGSAFYISQSSANISSTKFYKNVAKEAATVIAESDSDIQCNNCTFQENFADDSVVLFAQNNIDKVSRFTNSLFILNKAQTNMINLLYSNFDFHNSLFLDNIAEEVNHGITMISSRSLVSNCTIDYTLLETSIVDTGFFNLNYRSELIIDHCVIKNCHGAQGSAIYVTGQSSLELRNGTRIEDSKSMEGSTVYGVLAYIVKVNNVTFVRNKQRDIYLAQTEGEVTNSKFIDSAMNSIFVTSANVTIANNIFEDTRVTDSFLKNQLSPEYIANENNFQAGQGKGIYCRCNGNSKIINNIFRRLSADEGAAVYLLDATRTATSKFTVTNNSFEFNFAKSGGALYLEDSVWLDLQKNNFVQNFAVQGGALYLSCNSQLTPNSTSNNNKTCNTTITLKNNFTLNTAQDGGAIKWTKDRPLIDKSTIYKGNQADYGPDVASYPGKVKLEFITNNDYVANFTKSEPSSSGLRMLAENTQNSTNSSIGYVPPLVSGNKMDFNLLILDQDGNLYLSDSSSKAVLDGGSASAEVIVLNNEAIAKNGMYSFRNVELRAKPGTSPQLKLAISGLETFGNQLDFTQEPITIKTEVRKCVSGEELTVDNRCRVCPEGWFQYFVPEENKTTPCQQCPKDAKCFGKASVAPLPGYWRQNDTTSNFIKCPNTPVCLGGDNEHPLGKCSEGYQGIVCGDCAPNYSKSKQFECKGCPDKTRNMIQTVLILIGSIFYISFLVRQTLNSADQQKSVSSVYMKILTNHIQILGAISNIDYKWPKEIEQFQASQNQVATASSQIFSFDCFLMGDDGMDNGVPVFFQKLIMYGVLPFVMMLMCLLFWAIVGRVQKKTVSEFRSKYISTIIVVLFLFYPDIANCMFLTFNCVEIDGVFRMKENVRSICYEGQHLFFISVVAFPAIGLWIFGIPLFAFFVLFRNKRVLLLMDKKIITKSEEEEIKQVKMKYGFLFAGYDAKTYFWEVIIMYRKTLIIATSVFLSTVSSESQVLVVIFIIVMSMFLQIRFNPFYTSTLNKMENYSLQVAAVTIYTGMYYVTGKHYTYMSNQAVSWFFLVCIVLPNIVFLAYWAFYMRLEVLKTIHAMNLKPWMFKAVGWMHPDQFYKSYMEEEIEENKRNQVRVDPDPEGKTPGDDMIAVEDVKVQIEKQESGTSGGPGDDMDKSVNDPVYTMDDLMKQTARGGRKKSQRYQAQPKDSVNRQRDAVGAMSARSFKVFPETSLPATARQVNDFTDLKQSPGFNTPKRRNSDDLTDETSVPLHTGLGKDFKINNTVMLNKIKSRADRVKARFGLQSEGSDLSPEEQAEVYPQRQRRRRILEKQNELNSAAEEEFKVQKLGSPRIFEQNVEEVSLDQIEIEADSSPKQGTPSRSPSPLGFKSLRSTSRDNKTSLSPPTQDPNKSHHRFDSNTSIMMLNQQVSLSPPDQRRRHRSKDERKEDGNYEREHSKRKKHKKNKKDKKERK